MKLPKHIEDRFDEKFKIFEQVSGDEADGTFAIEKDRKMVKDFIAQILEEEKKRLVGEIEEMKRNPDPRGQDNWWLAYDDGANQMISEIINLIKK